MMNSQLLLLCLWLTLWGMILISTAVVVGVAGVIVVVVAGKLDFDASVTWYPLLLLLR